MTSPVISLPSYAQVIPTLKMMTKLRCRFPTLNLILNLPNGVRFRHVPIVDGEDNVIGLISIGDLVKEMTAEYRETIDTLRDYVTKRTY